MQMMIGILNLEIFKMGLQDINLMYCQMEILSKVGLVNCERKLNN